MGTINRSSDWLSPKNMNKVKHFLSITDLSAKEIWQVLLLAKKLKNEAKSGTKKRYSDRLYPPLKNKSMVMLFEKPSLRTKLSFDLAFAQLGGHVVYFSSKEVGLGKRESISDVAKVISSMADLIVARVFSHKTLVKLSKNSKVPLINALSDKEHPCQILADFLTILEVKGKLNGLTLAFIGDGENNVANSLKFGCEILGIDYKCSSPNSGLSLEQAAKGADIIYTDTWVSMGDEVEEKKRLKIFKPYQLNQKLMDLAKPDAIFMHCMPAHRGQEVTADVIDGPKSVVFHQAENRLHVQKALITHIML